MRWKEMASMKSNSNLNITILTIIQILGSVTLLSSLVCVLVESQMYYARWGFGKPYFLQYFWIALIGVFASITVVAIAIVSKTKCRK